MGAAWFKSNRIKANPDKCHFLLSETKSYNILIDNYTIDKSEHQKLGVILYKELTFKKHKDNLCTKAGQK